MTQGEEPGWAPPGAGPPADETGQPLPPGTGGPPWAALPPDAAGASRPEGLAVVALVLAVVSLLVPVLPGVVALVLAVMATRRARQARQAPGAAVGGRGLVTATLVLSTIGLLAWTGLGALAVMTRQEPAGWQAAAATGAAAATVGAGQFSQVTAPPPTEPPATEPPATEPPATEPATTAPVTSQPKVAAGRVGDRLTVYDELGTSRLEITVTRLKFSTGDEFDRPQHGLYMGAYVKVHALADEQDTPWEDSYALVGGRHYRGDVITSSTAFDPPLEPLTLSQGEGISGWLVFDVPARHGQLVLRDILDERNLGIWKY
jgi:hypothetical protein